MSDPTRATTRNPLEPKPGQVFLSIKQICSRYGIHRSTFHRWVNTRGFPAPVQFSPSCSRIPLSEVEAWEQAQLSERGAA